MSTTMAEPGLFTGLTSGQASAVMAQLMAIDFRSRFPSSPSSDGRQSREG
jgi:hypothetical protein